MVRWPGAAPGSSRSQRDTLLLSYAPEMELPAGAAPAHPRYKGDVLLLNYESEKLITRLRSLGAGRFLLSPPSVTA